MRRELYQTFGSRSEYLSAPWPEVQEERLRIVAEHRVQARKDEELQGKIAEQEAEAKRLRG